MPPPGRIPAPRNPSRGPCPPDSPGSRAAQDRPHGLPVALHGAPSPYVAERLDNLQATSALALPAGLPRRRRVIIRVEGGEHHFAGPPRRSPCDPRVPA